MFKKDIHIHFIGIGGIGMSGIAEVLIKQNYFVSGSDVAEGKNIQKLREMGAQIYLGHQESNITNPTVVVYSSAISKDNPEYVTAKSRGIPLIRRAEMLSELMRLKYGIAVAGTHGKTTTTSFMATILQESGVDATHIIGGVVENLHGHAKVGQDEILVAEADESDGSFLLLNPIISIITNIDDDHLDHYKDEANLTKAFIKFANKVPFYGLCCLNSSDEKVAKIIPYVKRPWVTFGIAGKGSGHGRQPHFEARDLVLSKEGSQFKLFVRGEFSQSIRLNVPGEHNVYNALGAIAVAYHLGIAPEKIAYGLQQFRGVGRRFEHLYRDEQRNIEIIDDYGHHPTEIVTTLKALTVGRENSKLIVFFEPHRYSRTLLCWEKFIHCFDHADELYLLPIYAASEINVMGVSAKKLVSDINNVHAGFAHYVEDLQILQQILTPEAKNLSIVVLGAGSIGKRIRDFVKEHLVKSI